MNDARQLALKTFLFIGERFALVVIIILGIVVFSTQKESTLAFAEPQKEAQIISSIPIVNAPQNQVRLLEQEIPPTPQPEADRPLDETSTPEPTITPIPTATPTPILVSPTPTPTPTVMPSPTTNPTDDSVWDKLAACESGGNWSIDIGNGYFGGLQFNQGAWESVGGTGNPAQASREEQIAKGKLLQQKRGWGAWGGCSTKLGLN